MDRNFFVAMALCAGIYLAWSNYYVKQLPQTTPAQTVSQDNQTTVPSATAPVALAVNTNKQNTDPVKKVILGDEQYSVTINSLGGIVESTKFNYKKMPSDTIAELISGSGNLFLGTTSKDWTYISNINYQTLKVGEKIATLTFEDDNVKIERQYTLKNEIYSLEHQLKIHFKKARPDYITTGIRTKKEVKQAENERRNAYYILKSGTTESHATDKFLEGKENINEGRWTGVSSRYFLSALVHRDDENFPAFQGKENESTETELKLVYKTKADDLNISQRLFYGPKDVSILKAAGSNLELGVDFGWFTFLAYPMLFLLKWFHGFVNNFGIAIILLTVVVKIITYPLTYKSMKGMKKMQKFQPQMQKLKEKYADDKQKMNQEMMQLMKSSGYNPMGGCFPILIQMPVFIALYNVLYGAIDLFNQPFFGWIHDLSLKDPFYITPIALSGLMFLQQKLTPQSPGMDPNQQKMMTFMPLIFGFMMMSLPAGLTLYMLVNSVVSILQTLIINKALESAEAVSVV